MPEDTYVVMKVMLKFLRLDFITLDSGREQFSPPTVFMVAGYESICFFENMGYFLSAMLFLPVLIYLLSLCKDKCCSSKKITINKA